MSKSFLLIDHINYQMTIILSREISSGLSLMSCVQTLQTCLAATCLPVWSHESGQDLTSRVRELMRILIFSQLTCGASLFFFLNSTHKLRGASNGEYHDETQSLGKHMLATGRLRKSERTRWIPNFYFTCPHCVLAAAIGAATELNENTWTRSTSTPVPVPLLWTLDFRFGI